MRRADNPDTPLRYESYADLIESWTMEYFEEYLDWSPDPVTDARLGRTVPRRRERGTASQAS